MTIEPVGYPGRSAYEKGRSHSRRSAYSGVARERANAEAQGSGRSPNTTAPTKVTGDGIKTESGLQYWDIKEGLGEPAKAGDHVKVHYTGWLTTGKKFDSSVDAHQPYDFTLGQGDVIKGWDEGVAGMKVGGKRQLRIPPDLAYGEAGFKTIIPPDATLIFDVQLLAIK